VTPIRDTERIKPPLSAAQRQRRYRAKLELCSIDISRKTVSLVAKLRARTGMNNDEVIAAAAEMLHRSLKANRRPSGQRKAQRKNLEELTRRAEVRSLSGDKAVGGPTVGEAEAISSASPAPRTRRKGRPKPEPRQAAFDF